MIPDPMAKLLKTENINSPMRLLATTWAFRILNTFGKSTTQKTCRSHATCGQNNWQHALQEGNTSGAQIENEGFQEPRKDLQLQRSQQASKTETPTHRLKNKNVS